MFGLGPQELVILAVLGVLLFGSKLPVVGRQLAQAIVSFRNGLRGVEDSVESSLSAPAPAPAPRPPQRLTPAAPKFDDAPGV